EMHATDVAAVNRLVCNFRVAAGRRRDISMGTYLTHFCERVTRGMPRPQRAASSNPAASWRRHAGSGGVVGCLPASRPRHAPPGRSPATSDAVNGVFATHNHLVRACVVTAHAGTPLRPTISAATRCAE